MWHQAAAPWRNPGTERNQIANSITATTCNARARAATDTITPELLKLCFFISFYFRTPEPQTPNIGGATSRERAKGGLGILLLADRKSKGVKGSSGFCCLRTPYPPIRMIPLAPLSPPQWHGRLPPLLPPCPRPGPPKLSMPFRLIFIVFMGSIRFRIILYIFADFVGFLWFSIVQSF